MYQLSDNDTGQIYNIVDVFDLYSQLYLMTITMVVYHTLETTGHTQTNIQKVCYTVYRDLLATITFGGIVKFYNWRD